MEIRNVDGNHYQTPIGGNDIFIAIILTKCIYFTIYRYTKSM